MMKFIQNAPAIIHKDAIIVSDTHFGIESRLREKGIYQSNFSLHLCDKLIALAKKHKKKKIIIVGDVKENITSVENETRAALAKLVDACKVQVVKGNHDGGLEYAGITGIDIVGPEGFVFSGVGLVHGHAWPDEKLMKCKYIICGHQHQHITFNDTFGKRHSEPAWIIAPLEKENAKKYFRKLSSTIKLILMPPFNPLVGKTLNMRNEKQLGPLLNNKIFKLERALVVRLDGTMLGKLRGL